jgi:hypothetical protein
MNTIGAVCVYICVCVCVYVCIYMLRPGMCHDFSVHLSSIKCLKKHKPALDMSQMLGPSKTEHVTQTALKDKFCVAYA